VSPVNIVPMDYQVFGGFLRSDLEFPSLPPAPPSALPTWRLHVLDAPAPERTTSELKSEQLSDELNVTLARIAEGIRVTYSDTGSYDLTDGGRTITWYRPADPDLGNARLDVLGTLLTLALHLNDHLTLHGSAVAFDSGVIAFLAPSGFGKSTLAMSLTVSGARFMSDDAVPVRVIGTEVIASPGVPSPRFRQDSFARFQDLLPNPVTLDNGKVSSGEQLADDVIEARERPLTAIYLLNPVTPDTATQLNRVPLPPMVATVHLLRNAKLAKLLWAEESQRLFTLVSEVARHVPVWSLEVPRDMDLLPSVVEQLLAWHGREHADLA
jgi:hypothetical protein